MLPRLAPSVTSPDSLCTRAQQPEVPESPLLGPGMAIRSDWGLRPCRSETSRLFPMTVDVYCTHPRPCRRSAPATGFPLVHRASLPYPTHIVSFDQHYQYLGYSHAMKTASREPGLLLWREPNIGTSRIAALTRHDLLFNAPH